MKWPILILSAALLAGGAPARPGLTRASPRLAPEQAAPAELAGYAADLRRTFREAFGPDVILRAVVRPSFETEYAVGLRRQGTGYEIFALRPERQVWSYQMIKLYRSGRAGVMTFDGADSDDPDKLFGDPGSKPRDATAEATAELEKGLPADPGDLPLARCALAVDNPTATALEGAWRHMLGAVRPGEELLAGLDGSSYTFSMEVAGRTLAGETWTPRRDTRPGRIARLAEAMREYCETREAGRLPEIVRLARRLGSTGSAAPR